MDKKILSAAIIAVMAAPVVALADVTVYGQVDLSINAQDIDGASDDINMASNNSRVGLKGSEDLGNGLNAIFQLEYTVDPSGSDTAAGDIGTGRDQWIGLDGGFGKVRFGTMSTLYKSTGSSIDPLWDSALDTRATGMQSGLHSGDGSNGEGRATNTVGYDTPDFNGFTAGATYSFDENCTAASAPGCSPDDDAYSLGGKYANGPILAFVDYVTSDQGGDDDAWKIGGSYSFGDAAVYGQFESDGGLIANGVPGSGAGVSNDSADVWMLGGSYTMGSAMLVAQYGQGDDDSAAGADTGYDSWTVAGVYSFSKRTLTYAGFNQISDDCAGCGETDTFGVGLRHKF
ncbi:MAG: porin [Gammaproteobacteria bacterium]|nr:porin [Gammaproteobacteria bacterium]